MKITTSVLIALLSLQAAGADIRDATFNATTQAGVVTYDQGQRAIEQTYKIADLTADKLKAFFSKSSEFTVDLSGDIADAIVKLAKLAPPVFKLTADGFALVFEASGNTTQAGLDVSRKLVILLEPTTESTKKILENLVEISKEGTTQATELTDAILKKLAEMLEKPLELSTDASSEVSDLIFELLDASSEGSTEASRIVEKIINKLAKILNKSLEVSSNASTDALNFTGRILEKPLELSTQATDKSLEISSEVLDKLLEISSQSTEASAELVTKIIKKLIPILEKALEASSDASVDTTRLIIKIVDAIMEVLDKPIDMTIKGTNYSEKVLSNISRVLERVLDKSLDVSLDATSDASDLVDKLITKILDLLDKPMELSTEGTRISIRTLNKLLNELSEVLSDSTELSSDVVIKLLKLMDHVSENSVQLSINIIGEKNIQAAGDLSRGATKLSLDTTEAIFYFITKNVTALSNIFDSNRKEREQLEEIYEREDELGKAGIRDLIRSEIRKEIKNGEVLDQLLTDEFVDTYIKVRLAVGEE